MIPTKIKTLVVKSIGEINFMKIRNLFISFNQDFFYSFIGIFKSKSKSYPIDRRYFFFPKSSPLHFYGENFKNYELPERILANKAVEATDAILEVGGCVGVISCILNKKLHDPKNHLVLEPNPNMLKLLHRNRKLNSCQFIVEQGIISNNKYNDFYIHPDYLGSSVFKRGHSLFQKINVEGLQINKLIKKHKIRFNVLIMDIEGHEIEVLKTSDITIFKKIIVEFHFDILKENGYNECINILKKNNFQRIEKIENVEYWMSF